MKVDIASLPAAYRRQAEIALSGARRQPKAPIAAPSGSRAGRRKYRNEPIAFNGQRFDSKLELRCWQWLERRRSAGEIVRVVPQVSVPIEGGRYRVDFLAERADGGSEWIDAKGYDTAAGKRKRRQMFERYGIAVVLWPPR